MTDIKLINENGVIKGIDPETGEEVPIEVSNLDAESVSATETTAKRLKRHFGKIISNAGKRPYLTRSQNAVYRDGVTYISYRGCNGNTHIISYNHGADSYHGPRKVGESPLDISDEHDVPALDIDSDGYLHIVFGSHDTPFRYGKSDSPNDIASFSVRELNEIPDGTYPSLATVGDDLYLFYRSGSGHKNLYPSHRFATLARSTDGGDRWTDVKGPAIDTTGAPESVSDVYVSGIIEYGGQIYTAWNVARGDSHDGSRTNVYYAVFGTIDDIWSTIDGQSLGTTINWSNHPDCLVAELDDGNLVHDVSDDGRIAVSFTSADAGPCYVIEYDGGWGSVEKIDDLEVAEGVPSVRYTEDGTLEAWLTGNTESRYGELWRAQRNNPGEWETTRYGSGGIFSYPICIKNGRDEFAIILSVDGGDSHPSAPATLVGGPYAPDNPLAEQGDSNKFRKISQKTSLNGSSVELSWEGQYREIQIVINGIESSSSSDVLHLSAEGAGSTHSWRAIDGTTGSGKDSLRLGEVQEYSVTRLSGCLSIYQSSASRSRVTGPLSSAGGLGTGLLVGNYEASTNSVTLSLENGSFTSGRITIETRNRM